MSFSQAGGEGRVFALEYRARCATTPALPGRAALLPADEAIDDPSGFVSCIDSDFVMLTTNQRSGARATGTCCDAGAYEHGSALDRKISSGFD